MIATEFLFSSITSPLLELNKNIWYASQRKVDVNRELSRDMRKNRYVWKKKTLAKLWLKTSWTMTFYKNRSSSKYVRLNCWSFKRTISDRFNLIKRFPPLSMHIQFLLILIGLEGSFICVQRVNAEGGWGQVVKLTELYSFMYAIY